MLSFFAQILLVASGALAAPVENAQSAAATVGKIRGVRDPIYHLYLQASAKNASIPVLGPETAADEFTIGGTIQSKKTSQYLNIATASTSYKPLVWGATGETTAWGLEGDTIITVQSSSYGRHGERYAEWKDMQQLPDDPSTVSVLEVPKDGRWLCMQVPRDDNRAVENHGFNGKFVKVRFNQ